MTQKLISKFAFLFALVLFPPLVDARILTVGFDGNSEYANIQSAVDAAGPDDTILLADGTYTGPGNRGVTINKPLTIRGIGGPEKCIIDCEEVTRAFTVQMDDPNATIVFEGVTVKNGVSDADNPNESVKKGNGGGILFSGRGMTRLINCVVLNNRIHGDNMWAEDSSRCQGGGICCFGEWNVFMDRCRIQGNGAVGENGRSDYNWAEHGGWTFGGALGGLIGEFNLEHCEIIGNYCIGGDTGQCLDDEGQCYTESMLGGEASGAAIYVWGTVNIHDSLIVGNTATGGSGVRGRGIGTILDGVNGVISNCTLFNNQIYSRNPRSIQVLWSENIEIINSILQDRSFKGAVQLSNCWIEGEPLFADPANGDYHLKSKAGRWDPMAKAWVKDAVSSPCIDAGDPADMGWMNELWPNGRRIDIGAYGGTPQASLSENAIGLAADLNFDDRVDITDFSIFARGWMKSEPLLAADLTRDNHVGLDDLALLAESWMK